MAFYGQSFSFHDTPCEAFDLMMYDIAGEEQGETVFASVVSIQEETVSGRYRPYFYGAKFEEKLEFEMVFGVNQHRLDAGNYLDRFELDAVATWLTGHDSYAWLVIEQEDMNYARFRCMITELSVISFGQIPWALRAKVVCDSPFAYMAPHAYQYEVRGEEEISFYNESSYNGYYYPIVQIDLPDGGDFEIINESDGHRSFSFKGIPASVRHVTVDNDHYVITNDQDLNIYPNFNYNFFRLKRGYNKLRVKGNGTLFIICEFPVNPGG